MLAEAVEKGIYRAIRRAAVRLPPDVQKALEAALERETTPMARSILEAILRNLRAAEERGFDSDRFLNEVALKNDVSYVPGSAFYPPFGYSYEPETNSLEPL
ncbi:MAG TPA: hypothetical protein ENF83_02290, partial [Candidatus Korarchaeota archaeon]|nr:hypothetical protein [Candidatus Korarchaeota archaeon]